MLVAVPGCATPVEKRAVFNSAGRAGARVVFVISEAKASAIGAGLPIAEPVASMICDIGGGTTDVAILSLGEIVASQSIRVAGDAMDRAVVDYLKRNYSLRVGLPAAEALRIEIGSAYPLEEELVEEVRGVDAVTGLPRKAILTSEEIREALAGRWKPSWMPSAKRSTSAAPTWPPIWSTTAWCWPVAVRCSAVWNALSKSGPAFRRAWPPIR